MSPEAVINRQPLGAPNSEGGRFAGKALTESSTRLVPFDGLSANTRAMICSDLVSQRGHVALQLEHLREESERVAEAAESAQRALDDLDQRIADLSADVQDDQVEAEVGGATRYRGPGHVDDVVEVAGYGTFTRRRAGVYADQPYSMRVQVDRELAADEAQHLAQLVGYDWSKTGGERLGDPFQDAPNSIVIYADSTKGRAYRHLDRFEDTLETTVTEGSPVRLTDRSGPKGTRLVVSLADIGGVHIYYDSVCED